MHRLRQGHQGTGVRSQVDVNFFTGRSVLSLLFLQTEDEETYATDTD